jgi:SAM-dependent methyltransferase
VTTPFHRSLGDAARQEHRRAFDSDAERYAARRPTYPTALFDRLAAYGRLGEGARVLEVGPGTGQATRSLAERGWRVTAVELGADLAAVARRTLAGFPDVDVVTGAFEEWTPPAERYDAFVCATAWHWLDPATRLGRVAGLLRPGGTVAIVWTHHVAGGTEGFLTAAQDCYRRFDPGSYEDGPRPEHELPASTGELLGSAMVADVESHRYAVEVGYDREEYLDLLRTYSTTIRLPAGQRDGLLDCLGDLVDRCGGRVVKRYVFELVLARRAVPVPTGRSEGGW